VVAVIVTGGACVLGTASFIGALLGSVFGLGEASPRVVLGVWFGVTIGFLFLWIIGLLTELQRSETIDLQRLMHLPVALGQMFVVNYVVSHVAFSIVLTVPAMLGLALGLACVRGLEMVLLVPLALSMVFMITAWTYYLRGWLAALMSNPRRRRTIIMVITLTFVLLSQGPNLYFSVIRRFDRPSTPRAATAEERQRLRRARRAADRAALDRLLAAQKFVPPLWLPNGAWALAEGRPLPALLGIVGCVAIGALGLRRAYRSTMRFYHGQSGQKVWPGISPPTLSSEPRSRRKSYACFLEWTPPGLPEQAAALALATFRSMLRAPEVKMAWGTSFLVTIILGVIVFLRSAPNLPAAAKPFVITGVAAFSIFMLVQFLANQFGFDRDGFRALVLSPSDRRYILLAKNLATLPVGATFGGLLVVFASIWLRLPMLDLAAALLQLATMLMLAGMGGNLLSVLMPYRIAAGSMKPVKMPAMAMLVTVLCQMLFPVVMAPVLVPPFAALLWQMLGWPGTALVNLVLSTVLVVLTALAYRQLLAPMGRLLQRREMKILSMVSVEVE